MAKRKNRTSEPKKRRKKEEEEESTDSAEKKKEKQYFWDENTGSMQQGLLVILLFAAAAISLLSFINAAGDVGKWVDTVFGWLFGWGRFVTPIIFAAFGYIFLHPEEYKVKVVNYIGLALFLLSGLALLHLAVPIDELTVAAKQGRGGGYFAIVLAYPLLRFAGVWVTIVVLIGLFLGSWMIMFNTSLKTILSHMQIGTFFLRPFQWVRSRLHARVNGYTVEKESDEEGNEEEDAGVEESEDGTAAEEESDAQVFSQREVEFSDQVDEQGESTQLELIPQQQKKRRKRIDLPVQLLSERIGKPTSGDIEANKQKIHDTLASFGIEVEMAEVSVGPMVTQYTLKPSQGVKLTQITTLHNDIALALAAHPIRIEAPIPGKPYVGIEVPNKTAATVTVRELLSARAFKQDKNNPLKLCLGKDVSGKPYYPSMDSMPHLLIAGATGSGKSVCINSIIISLLYQNSPSELRFIMVDPKRVELTVYNDIPHLLTPVITDVEKTVNALKWTVAEMERRYDLLSRAGKRNIASFNESVPEEERLPYIIFVIDELADLMSTASQSVEAAIVRLAQMARAIGIHLILATQRPSVNVITGLIKANMPARIAFSVASLVDSRTILDFSGAEKLLGRGDMLYIDSKLSKPKRLQGSFVDDKEIERIVEYLRNQGDPEYDGDVTEKMANSLHGGVVIGGGSEDENSDEFVPQAKEVILQAGKASASLLQRRLRIGYARAARILDILEEQGFIGPAEGAKPREILAIDEEAVMGEPGENYEQSSENEGEYEGENKRDER